jgi:hypothetical protein
LSLGHHVQRDTGPTHSPIQKVPGSRSLEITRLKREADQSHLFYIDVKNVCFTSTPSIRFRGEGLKHRDNFACTCDAVKFTPTAESPRIQSRKLDLEEGWKEFPEKFEPHSRDSTAINLFTFRNRYF